MKRLTTVFILLLVLAPGKEVLGSVLDAATGSPKIVTVAFDHAADNENRSYFRVVAPGQIIRVTIKNTCPEAFSYSATPVAREPKETAVQVQCQKVESKVLDIVHNEANGGYIVTIKRTAGDPVLIGTTPLNDVELIITVDTNRWDYEIAGGFTGSDLVDEEFGLVEKVPEGATDGVAKPHVVRDEDAEDTARLGAAALVHVFHRGWPHLAPTFGLGINQENKTTYIAGLSWRFGEVAAFTVGRTWGEVKTLPPGTDITKPVPANFLSSLDTRTDRGWVLAFSFKFLNPGNVLEKPFKAVNDTTAAGSSGAGGATGGGGSQLPKPGNLALDGPVGADCSFKLKWDPVPSAEGYRISVADDAASAKSEVTLPTGVTIDPAAPSVTLKAEKGKARDYFVQATKGGAPGAFSDGVKVDATGCTGS